MNILNKKNRKIIYIILVLIIVSAFFFLNRKKDVKVTLKDYNIVEVKKSNDIGDITLNGQVMANNPIGIFVDKKLKVKEVFVKNGDYVEKNEILVTFDDDEKNKILRSMEREKIILNRLRRNLKTTRELYKIGGTSSEEVKNLEGDYRISELKIEELQEILDKTAKEIKSPVSGVVSNLKAQENYLVDTDRSLMEIIDSEDLKIVIEIPEYDAGLVKLGQKVSLKPEVSDDDKTYKGKISKISKISTISKLTSENVLEAEVKAEESIPNLVTGFKIKADLKLKAEELSIIIPKISILFEENSYFVFVIDEKNKIKKVKIKIKNLVGDNTIVTEGLKVGEKIIATPDNRLKDGLILK